MAVDNKQEWVVEKDEAFYTTMMTDNKGEKLVEETSTLKMDAQMVRGIDTGRKAMQVVLPRETVFYRYAGSGKDLSLTKLSNLPKTLRDFVTRGIEEFANHTGLVCNSVLIQLYLPTAGIGAHRDNTDLVECVGPVLSYNGGHSFRVFRLKDDAGKWVSIDLTPGSAVFFEDGERLHELQKPYTCTKAKLKECQAKDSHPDRCVFLPRRFVCHHPDCTSRQQHACQCTHLRLNITWRRLRGRSPPSTSQKKRSSSFASSSSSKRQKEKK